jgi:hypothetical protein
MAIPLVRVNLSYRGYIIVSQVFQIELHWEQQHNNSNNDDCKNGVIALLGNLMNCRDSRTSIAGVSVAVLPQF